MAESVGPVEFAQPERVRELHRPADVLVDLDHAARAHHPELRMLAAHPGLRVLGLGLDRDDYVIRAWAGFGRPAERLEELSAEPQPVLVWMSREERQLAGALRHRIAVDGDAGAVGTAIAHLDQHLAEVDAQPVLELGRLAVETDDPAHGAPHTVVEPDTASQLILGVSERDLPTFLARLMWSFTP